MAGIEAEAPKDRILALGRPKAHPVVRRKRGCAQGQVYGFIPVVKTGGAVNLLPELDQLWHIRAGEYCKSQANAGSLLGQRARRRVPVYRKISRHRLRRDRHGS